MATCVVTKKIVRIIGEAETSVPLSRCAPGLVLVDNELGFTRGDGRAYRLSDGSEFAPQIDECGPEGTYYMDRMVEPIDIDE